MLKPKKNSSNVVIIVGSGAAGLSAAIEACNEGAQVKIITKELYSHANFRWVSKGGCTWKTNAFNAAVGRNDTVESHIRDTFKGGGYAGNLELIEVLCKNSIELIPWLADLGLKFEKDDNGDFLTRPYGGCEFPRAVYIDDRLGFYIQQVLNEKVKNLIRQKKIEIYSGLRAIKILKNEKNEVAGIQALDSGSLEIINFYANSVILADGGGASMYSPTAVAHDKTCDGIVLGLDAGVSVIDMEFVQFHPTGLASQVATFDGALIGENMRFQGAKLLNKANHRFMFDYHPEGEVATRDEVSRGIFFEILSGRCFENNSVMLDISECQNLIINNFPALKQRLIQAGYDPFTHTKIYIRPTAHFLMGGLQVNTQSQTCIDGLFVAGESMGGVHGANRLGGNGLAEALVFGRISGKNAGAFAKTSDVGFGIHIHDAYRVNYNGKYMPEQLLLELRKEMYFNAGLVRNETKLVEMKKILEEIEEKSKDLFYGSGSRASSQIQNAIDLKNLLKVSKIIVESALLRKESRGAHYRSDYPDTEKNFTGILVKNMDNEPTWQTYSYGNQAVIR